MITRKVDKQDGPAGFIYYWVRALAAEVDHLDVLCLEKGDGNGLPDNVSVYSMGKERGKNRIREFVNFQKYALKFIPKSDGVFTHQNPEYGILASFWCRIFRKYLIAWYAHGTINLKARVLHSLVDKVATSSAPGFAMNSPKRVVLHQGINTDHFTYIDDIGIEPRVLSVSRLSKSKNIDQMIELVAHLRNQGVTVHLEIVGSPILEEEQYYEQSLRKLAEDTDVVDLVTFTGSIPYGVLPDVYKRSSLFINFSQTGSMDKTVLEAMSCGLPVAVSNPAYAMLADIDKRFYGNDIQEMSEKILSLIKTPPDNQVRTVERDWVVNNHSLGQLASDIVSLYTIG